MYFARIKPHDPRKGQVARSYTSVALNRRFSEGVIYRDLTEAEATALRAIQQPKAGRGALFDVGTAEEMEGVLSAEAADRLGVSRTVGALVVPPPRLAPAAPALETALPVETLEHVDVGGQRIQLTQPAPPEPAAAPAPTPKGPKKPGGGAAPK